MNVNQLQPIPAESIRVRFSVSQRRKVPAEAGCYVLASFDNYVLYVGLTDSLRRRFGEHNEDVGKCAVVDGRKVFWFYFIPMPVTQVARVERGWQNQFSSLHGSLPPFNRIASPVR